MHGLRAGINTPAAPCQAGSLIMQKAGSVDTYQNVHMYERLQRIIPYCLKFGLFFNRVIPTMEDALLTSHDKKEMLFPISKEAREKYEAIKADKKVLIVGLTGGIASGKSTVAQFLKELGGVIIDFDILARQAVRPGEKAWRQIVEFFGEGVLLDNKELDRKKISRIVFSDPDKRKRLEGFTHPAIAEEFVREVEKTSSEENKSLIFAVVPLLIEGGMQRLFHAIAVVYIPGEKQIERLIQRDGITRDRAIGILSAQIPIDEKIGFADFVIDNEESLEETKRQVQNLWDRLLDRQRGMKV
jgi:dephospho-CoA kinase